MIETIWELDRLILLLDKAKFNKDKSRDILKEIKKVTETKLKDIQIVS